MSKIITSIEGLIRRIRKMGEFWSTTGVLLIPFGFWLLVEYPDSKWMGVVAVVFGLVCWFTAYWIIRGREKDENKEKIQELKLRYLQAKGIERQFIAVLNELKALNKALSKDKEGSG